MLYLEIAQKFIERLTEYTEYNINIMDQNGIIIASRNPERIGSFHEVAHNIIANKTDIVEVSDTKTLKGVKPGVNLPLFYQGDRIGVIGVTGNPEEVKSVALIVKMAMETMLEYEYKREQTSIRKNLKDRFIHELFYDINPDIATIRHHGNQLHYDESISRIPILLHGEDTEKNPDLLERIKNDAKHTSQDLTFLSREGDIVIFKTLPDKKRAFADYPYVISDYLHLFLRYVSENDLPIRFYIGSIQNQFHYYKYALEHCYWLKNNVESNAHGIYFYEYVDDYLKSMIPEKEWIHIFSAISENMDRKTKKSYTEIMSSLKETNYNMGKSSKQLYIHKNTLAFRLDKLKDLLNLNPMQIEKDRVFMDYLLKYLTRKDEKMK